MFKVNNRSTRGKCELCAKQGKVIDVVPVRYCIPFSSASMLEFEQVNIGLVGSSISQGVLVYILPEIYRNCDFLKNLFSGTSALLRVGFFGAALAT